MEVLMDKKLKITHVTIEPKWIYDTFRGAISIKADINNKPLEFVFRGSRCDNPMFAGIDCNEAQYGNYTWGGREHRVTISHGGGQTYFALHLYRVKDSPKENQKDFSFTGRYYSTVPLKNEFKEKLQQLWAENDITEEFKDYVLSNE
jgi:hypothetical protein